jgi:hypothetical protein
MSLYLSLLYAAGGVDAQVAPPGSYSLATAEMLLADRLPLISSLPWLTSLLLNLVFFCYIVHQRNQFLSDKYVFSLLYRD